MENFVNAWLQRKTRQESSTFSSTFSSISFLFSSFSLSFFTFDDLAFLLALAGFCFFDALVSLVDSGF